MPCCSRNKTDGKEPQKITSNSDQPSERIQPIVQVKSPNSKIDYTITVKTGNNRNSGTNGPVYIRIFGRDNKQTEDILLATSANETFFQQDSTKKLQIKASDVGKPQRIIIRHEDKTNGWYIDYIEISVHNFLIRFVANRWLDETKHDRKLSAELFGSEEPAAWYNIEIQTGSAQMQPLDSPAYMQIFGTTTNTPKIFLESKNASFAKDTQAKFNISSNNVGEIQKVIIGHEDRGIVNDWYLESVKIQTDQQQHEFTVDKWLSSTKDDKQLFVELHPGAPAPSPAMYMVTVRTGNAQHSGTIENVEMSIRGSNGLIDRTLLKDHRKSDEQQIFQKGNSDQFEIKHKDIGNIESLTIGFRDNDQKPAWLLDSVDIKYKETVYHFRAQCWLSSRLGPNFNWITIKSDTNNDDIDYKVTIDTGEGGIAANVILCIYGDKHVTKNFALRTTKDGTQAKFDKDSHLVFDLQTVDVGKITKINVGHDGEATDEHWLLKSIEINKKDEHYTFKPNRWLSKEQHSFIDLLPEESLPPKDQAVYKITVVTSSEDDSSTDSGVFMTIYGDKDRTKQFQLIRTGQNPESLFKQGDTNEFELEVNDVGNITKINIGQDGKGLRPMWHLATVQIQKGSEIYKFNADQVLDFSMPYIDLIPVMPEEPSTPEPVEPETSVDEKPEMKDVMYKVMLQYASLQQGDTDDGNLHMVICGINGKTKKMPLAVNKKGELEFTAADVGQISKILLKHDENEHGVVRHLDHIIIRRGDERFIFNIDRAIDQNREVEFTLTSVDKLSDDDPNPRPTQPKTSLTTETSTSDVQRKDTDYTIKVSTGDRAFNGSGRIKILGEHGIITIPLMQPENGPRVFQSKASDLFTSRTTDVGKIKRITIEGTGIDQRNTWHVKKIQIIKGQHVYNFIANVRLDSKEPKVTLYPIEPKKGDYVQTELHRLKTSLRKESSKMHRPKHKAFEPFVYNDLSPYFDTSGVQKAIDAPVEIPSGYYTRVTALRVVEPWEAYGMDYGVNYELLRQRRSRVHSAKRSSSTQNGMMILPPLSLPYGGQVTYVNSDRLAQPHSSSSSTTRRRSSSRQHHRHMQTTTANA